MAALASSTWGDAGSIRSQACHRCKALPLAVQRRSEILPGFALRGHAVWISAPAPVVARRTYARSLPEPTVARSWLSPRKEPLSRETLCLSPLTAPEARREVQTMLLVLL